MSDLQAAFDLAQLERIDQLLEKSAEFFSGTGCDWRTLQE
jgi:hypothetical protein